MHRRRTPAHDIDQGNPFATLKHSRSVRIRTSPRCSSDACELLPASFGYSRVWPIQILMPITHLRYAPSSLRHRGSPGVWYRVLSIFSRSLSRGGGC
jgi:hypothetical protein